MGQSQATNQCERDVEYYIPEGTLTEIAIGGSPGTITYDGTIYLYPRRGKKTTQIFPPNVTPGNSWLIDGNFYEKFIISGDSDFDSLFDSGKLVAYYHVGYRLELNQGPLGIQRYLITQRYNESLMRLLEKSHPRFNGLNPVSFNTSVAAAGTSSGTFSVNPGDELVIQGGIQSNSLGTAPAAASMFISDQNNRTVWNVVLAVLSSSEIKVRVPYQTLGDGSLTWNWKYTNGDSVAHNFLLNIYQLVA